MVFLNHYVLKMDVVPFNNILYVSEGARPENPLFGSLKSPCWKNKSGKFVVKRNQELIPRWRFLSPDKGESFFFQQLLLNQ
jgi:hypothetical protein